MLRSLLMLCILGGLSACMPAWRASLPETGGEVVVPGLDAEVEIIRDRWGVPHIRSETDEGVLFGLGWCHAQDRLFQMELNRRIGAGRLSEVFGKRSLGADRYLRTMGFRARAEEAAAQLAPEWQWLLDAYFAGVNAYLATDPPLPPEMRLLRIEPEPFEVADGFTWIKIMALGLGSDAGEEELRAVLLRDLDPELVEELLRPFPDEVYRDAWLTGGDGDGETVGGLGAAAPGRPTEAPGSWARLESAIPPFLRDLLRLADPGQEASRGSNNRVVDGAHTTTGAPLLANDPHLDFEMPALFQAWLIHLPGALVEGELGEHADRARGLNSSLLHRCYVAGDCSFCGDRADLDCEETADLAMERGRALLNERLGPDPADWRWGDLHDTVFHHILGDVPGLKGLLDRNVHVGGSPFTVAAAFYSPRRPFETRFGVSYRQVLDLADWDRSRYIHTTGQSSHPASPHYDDLMARWAGRQLIPMPFSEEAVDGVVRERQILSPGD